MIERRVALSGRRTVCAGRFVVDRYRVVGAFAARARAPMPNPSIERKCNISLRLLSHAAHVDRWASLVDYRLSANYSNES